MTEIYVKIHPDECKTILTIDGDYAVEVGIRFLAQLSNELPIVKLDDYHIQVNRLLEVTEVSEIVKNYFNPRLLKVYLD